MMEWGIVRVDHHQFVVGSRQTDTLDCQQRRSLLEVGPGFATLYTGAAYGPVTVKVEVLESAPQSEAFQEWEVVEEADVEVTTELVVMTLTGELADGLGVTSQLSPARYRVRAHTRGRDANWDMEVSEPSEDYWLQVWPAIGKSSFARIKIEDSVWSSGNESAAKDSMLDPAADSTLSSAGPGTTVLSDPNRSFAEKFAEWGGRPPAERFRLFDDRATREAAKRLAQLDRDLLDQLIDLPKSQQNVVARWAAKSAYERAGLADMGWVAPALTALDKHEPLPPPFDNEARVPERISKDPETPQQMSLHADGHQYVQWIYAVSSIFRALETKELAMLQPIVLAALTYGTNHCQELFDELRRTFDL